MYHANAVSKIGFSFRENLQCIFYCIVFSIFRLDVSIKMSFCWGWLIFYEWNRNLKNTGSFAQSRAKLFNFLFQNFRKDGTKFNSTYQTSLDELTVRTMLRLCEFKFTPTAEYDAFTSQIDSTPKTNCLLNLSSSYRSRSPNSQKFRQTNKFIYITHQLTYLNRGIFSPFICCTHCDRKIFLNSTIFAHR